MQPQQFVRGPIWALTSKHSLVIPKLSDWLVLTMQFAIYLLLGWEAPERAHLVMRWTSRAIEMKLKRLGVVVKQEFSRTTTTAIESSDLLTHE